MPTIKEVDDKRKEVRVDEIKHVSDESALLKNFISESAQGEALLQQGKINESYQIFRSIAQELKVLVQEISAEQRDEDLALDLENKEETELDKKKEEVKEDINHLTSALNKEISYWLREYTLLKKIHEVAKSDKISNKKGEIDSLLKRLKMLENRDVFRNKIMELKGAGAKLQEHISPRFRGQLSKFITDIDIFEKKILTETADTIDDLKNEKTRHYNLEAKIEKLIENIQALMIICKSLEKMLGLKLRI